MSTQCAVRQIKFFKWPTWEFSYHIIKCWFKASFCFACYSICNLIQCHANCNFCSYLRDWISCCFRCQCRGTRYTRVYFDNDIFVAIRIQCILYVTTTFDFQIANNIYRSGTKHLVLNIVQCLTWCHNNGVTCMYAYRVNIFHVTYDDAVVCTVAHDFVFNFFPTCNGTFRQDLVNW